ncbi:MAG: hypothetical protein IJL41_03770 [Clostridia bacterium]|nr:hypothetical protein [Clostridia bacterium]
MIKKFLSMMLICVMIASTLALLSSCDKPDAGQTTASDTGGQEQPPELTDGRTLFVYMCGSNLETKQGLAGKNIDEILAADAGDLNIVIQTGGAKTWRSHGISASATQRYEVKNGELILLDTLAQLNMGQSDALSGFIKWGQDKYRTKNNMLILWDHGGGSAKGVCFDENYSFDALTLSELKSAFENAGLYAKFDIIGFDACLMATVETAAYIRDYARYLVASEEIVPSGGWDYKAVAESYSSKEDPIQIGKDICDSFMAKCEKRKKADISTLSVIDLSGLDPIFERLDSLGRDLSEYVGKDNAFSKVIAAAKRCEKFGYESVFSGSSNMIDFLDFTKLLALSDFEEFAKMHEIVEAAVVYSVTGEERSNGGISFYYPIDFNAKEITEYISLGVSEPYNAFLSACYLNAPGQTVAFSDKGSVAENGAFKVSLTPESKKYLSTVTYNLIERDGDRTERILYSDTDIESDWDGLTFYSAFKGTRRLYNGHPICYAPVRIEETVIEYSAPISINGRKGNMHYHFYPNKGEEERFYAPRNWSSMKDNWLPNEFYNPWEGDTVQVAECLIRNGDGYIPVFGEEFEVKELEFEDLFSEITEVPLSGSTYYYVFVATDIFGNTYYSDMATFEMEYTYDELLEHPLPDGVFAGKVTKIEPYHID